MSQPATYTYVCTGEALKPLIEALRGASAAALDTEADSLHRYREKVCLIQISLEGRHWIVDPLADLDLDPLRQALESVELIVHGLDYDLRLLRRAIGLQPARVFDTMLAAQLTGREQVGLAALVEAICGIALDKRGQRADWSRRPLPPDLLAYAVEDTRHLHRVAEALREDLRRLGREEWHRESCERALAAALADRPDPSAEDDAWRIRGGRHLTGRAAAVLRELWRWRDRWAARLDRPPFKIAGSDVLLTYARRVEAEPGIALGDLPPPPEWLRGERRASFLRALERALTLPPEQWPPRPPRTSAPRATPEDEARLRELVRRRDALAERLGLHPGVLAPRDALRQWLLVPAATREAFEAASPLMQWQTRLLGGEAWAVRCGPPPAD